MEYSVFKARRRELQHKIDYNKQQEHYHRQQTKYYQEQLAELEASQEKNLTKLKEATAIENKLSIQEVADMLAVDKQQITDRILEKKAQKLVEKMMKGFK